MIHFFQIGLQILFKFSKIKMVFLEKFLFILKQLNKSKILLGKSVIYVETGCDCNY